MFTFVIQNMVHAELSMRIQAFADDDDDDDGISSKPCSYNNALL